MSLKQILGWAVIAFLAFYAVTSPSGAEHLLSSVVGGFKGAGNSISSFFGSL